MSLKNTLTNEKLGDRFDNLFSLITYAIGLAKVRALRGEGIDSNLANDVLEMIAKGNDQIDEDPEEIEEDEEE